MQDCHPWRDARGVTPPSWQSRTGRTAFQRHPFSDLRFFQKKKGQKRDFKRTWQDLLSISLSYRYIHKYYQGITTRPTTKHNDASHAWCPCPDLDLSSSIPCPELSHGSIRQDSTSPSQKMTGFHRSVSQLLVSSPLAAVSVFTPLPKWNWLFPNPSPRLLLRDAKCDEQRR